MSIQLRPHPHANGTAAASASNGTTANSFTNQFSGRVFSPDSIGSRLDPGEVFAVCSRAAVDAIGPIGERFGQAGVTRILERSAGSPPSELAHLLSAAIADHLGPEPSADVGVLVVSWTPSG
ncbi:hypothetical protein ABZU76_46240 [Amycolatopsis sp. NPDC005232]|uniref:hypothetical protein n=1 Tax=Amycolatopsis sp. NPDC005232 TaxID=3157027 RepID=UPI0033ABD024